MEEACFHASEEVILSLFFQFWKKSQFVYLAMRNVLWFSLNSYKLFGEIQTLKLGLIIAWFIEILGSSINHVVKILGIFDPPIPPSWSLLLNKAYVMKWSLGKPPYPSTVHMVYEWPNWGRGGIIINSEGTYNVNSRTFPYSTFVKTFIA